MPNENIVSIDQMGVIRNIRRGDQTPEIIEENKLRLAEAGIAQRAKGLPVLILADIRDLVPLSSDLRLAAARNLKDDRYDKIAILGTASAARIIANLVIMASGQSHHVRYFEEENSAMDWLVESATK